MFDVRLIFPPSAFRGHPVRWHSLSHRGTPPFTIGRSTFDVRRSSDRPSHRPLSAIASAKADPSHHCFPRFKGPLWSSPLSLAPGFSQVTPVANVPRSRFNGFQPRPSPHPRDNGSQGKPIPQGLNHSAKGWAGHGPTLVAAPPPKSFFNTEVSGRCHPVPAAEFARQLFAERWTS